MNGVQDSRASTRGSEESGILVQANVGISKGCVSIVVTHVLADSLAQWAKEVFT